MTPLKSKLVLTSIEKRIKPIWLAANKESEKLATKLGYTKTEEYKTYNINLK